MGLLTQVLRLSLAAIVAVAATVEQIPRSFGEWLSCLPPVLVVVVNYWMILLRAPRAADRS